MEREEERERRRLRDRQRRQSMTKEQRERHLARRRRNYQLRRQRAANAPLMPLHQSTISSNSSHHHHQNGYEQTLQILKGSSIQLEGFPKRLRLSTVKRLARNLAIPMSVPPTANHSVAADLISASSGHDGSVTKPLRLNRVKCLARSLTFPSEKTADQNTIM